MLELTEETREKLSALMDGELNEFETRQLLKQIDQLEPQQRAAVYADWQRMQLVSDALQGENVNRSLAAPAQDVAFMQSVSQAISSEQDLSHTERTGDYDSEASIQYLGGTFDGASEVGSPDNAAVNSVKTVAAPIWSKMAVAASVALAIVVGVQQTQLSAQNQRLLASQNNIESQVGAQQSVAHYDERQVALMADVESASSEQEQLLAQKRLIEYLSSLRERPSAADPFARVATFEEEAAVVDSKK